MNCHEKYCLQAHGSFGNIEISVGQIRLRFSIPSSAARVKNTEM